MVLPPTGYLQRIESPTPDEPPRGRTAGWLAGSACCIAAAVLVGPGLYFGGRYLPAPATPTLSTALRYVESVLTEYGPLVLSTVAFLLARSAINEIDRCLAPSTGLRAAELARGLSLTFVALSLLWWLALSPQFH